MRFKYILLPLATLFISNFAYAGATHFWCSVNELPGAKLCQDLHRAFIRDGVGPVLEFKFKGYGGEDHSIVNYSTDGGEFRLIFTEWGQKKTLMNPQGDSYQVQCGISEHGLCPRNAEGWPTN